MKNLLNPDRYLPILNGLIGDKLAEKNDSWAIPMSFRQSGKDVPVEALEKQYKGRSTVIFVHGLMADESIWKPFKALEKDFAVLYLRYNSGLHISENGQMLASLLAKFESVAKPKNMSLVGHSMGGLVIRSACHYGEKRRDSWIHKIKSIFLIAVPNAGAPLEKLGHLTTVTLNRLARWHLGTISDLINQRSNGIKDLRLGSMLEEDWKSPHAADSRSAVPPLKLADYHILVGSLAKTEKSLMGKYFGDGLVHHDSAVGATLIHTATVKVILGTGHNSILTHKDCFRHLKAVLLKHK